MEVTQEVVSRIVEELEEASPVVKGREVVDLAATFLHQMQKNLR